MAFLHLQQVSYHYPGHAPVVRAVDWRLARGEFHCLVGRSGCGKTTLLKLAAGLMQAHAGQVLLAGQRLLKPGPALGFVFQSPTLLEWRTVLDNVLLPITLQRSPDAADLARAGMLLELMGMASHADRYPPALSGGQQSRRCCCWTNLLLRWTLSPARSCRTTCCACVRWARPACCL
jgi:NitT/TauT family transport system ATP-binding protein